MRPVEALELVEWAGCQVRVEPEPVPTDMIVPERGGLERHARNRALTACTQRGWLRVAEPRPHYPNLWFRLTVLEITDLGREALRDFRKYGDLPGAARCDCYVQWHPHLPHHELCSLRGAST